MRGAQIGTCRTRRGAPAPADCSGRPAIPGKQAAWNSCCFPLSPRQLRAFGYPGTELSERGSDGSAWRDGAVRKSQAVQTAECGQPARTPAPPHRPRRERVACGGRGDPGCPAGFWKAPVPGPSAGLWAARLPPDSLPKRTVWENHPEPQGSRPLPTAGKPRQGKRRTTVTFTDGAVGSPDHGAPDNLGTRGPLRMSSGPAPKVPGLLPGPAEHLHRATRPRASIRQVWGSAAVSGTELLQVRASRGGPPPFVPQTLPELQPRRLGRRLCASEEELV